MLTRTTLVLFVSLRLLQAEELTDIFTGEGWEIAVEGFEFTDGLCADAEGNLYFSDVKGGTAVFVKEGERAVREFRPDSPGISGLQWGPDGRLYACIAREKRVVVFAEDGTETELAKEVRPNDLVVTERGDLYFTMTPTSEIRRIDANGVMTVVNAGAVTKPNGIALSPDQKTLAISDHGGIHVTTFPIQKDGNLGEATATMTMETAADTPGIAKGDGMTCDVEGRYYVTTGAGLQIFGKDGSLIAVVPKPDPEQGLVSVCFAGPGLTWLYIANGGKIYRRETTTSGSL